MKPISRFLFFGIVLGLFLLVCTIPSLGISSPDLSGQVYQATGTLHVDGSPVGMEVALDGRGAGQVPDSGVLIIENIAVGSHTITASFPGYVSQDLLVDVPDGLPAEVRVTLIEETGGSLDISSTPPQVQIYVDDVYMGITPAVFEVPSGTHEILLRLAGYQDWKAPAEVTAGQTTSISGTLIPISETPQSTPSGGPEIFTSLVLVVIGCLVAGKVRVK